MIQLKRPKSISVIGWIIIIKSVLSIPLFFLMLQVPQFREAMSLAERFGDFNKFILMLALGGLADVLSIIAGVAILKGKNWGRVLFLLVWPIFVGTVLGVTTKSGINDLIVLSIYIACAFFLTRPQALPFFGVEESGLYKMFSLVKAAILGHRKRLIMVLSLLLISAIAYSGIGYYADTKTTKQVSLSKSEDPLSTALYLANNLPQYYDRYEALKGVAADLRSAGLTERAVGALSLAVTAIDERKPDNTKVEILSRLATEFYDLGEKGESERLGKKALSLAKGLDEQFPLTRWGALMEVARHYADVGDFDKSNAIIDEHVGSEYEDKWEFTDLSIAYAKHGRFSEAIDIAGINCVGTRLSKAYGGISLYYAEAGQRSKALKLIKKADGWPKTDYLIKLSALYYSRGEIELAEQLIDMAYPSESNKEIPQAYASIGNFEKAFNTLKSTWNNLRNDSLAEVVSEIDLSKMKPGSVEDLLDRAKGSLVRYEDNVLYALAAIAVKEARLKNENWTYIHGRIMRMAGEYGIDEGKTDKLREDWFFANVLRLMIKEDMFYEALVQSENIRDPKILVRLLSKIGLAYSDKGSEITDEVRSVLLRISNVPAKE